MITASERAYAYAKACGIIGKSFVGRRIAALHPIRRLSELDRLVFGSEAKDLPERELLFDMEQRLSHRSVTALFSILNSYKKAPELLKMLIRVYEYSDLEKVLALLIQKEKMAKPACTPLGSYGTVNFDAWPDAKAMLEGTEFEFLIEKFFNQNISADDEHNEDNINLETILDRHYYIKLWESLKELKKSDREAAERIISEEIALHNCTWVLRLRSYYFLEAEEVKQHLVIIDEHPNLCRDALAALEFSLNTAGDWKKWRRVKFLNPPSHDGSWIADARYFQAAAAEYLYRLALRDFRIRPASMDAIYCFFKLKHFEEDLLISNTERLGMGMPSKSVLGVMETSL
ncbi:MAG: V-type ATPase subunit [Treponema sp.]|jgi:vacuolar-type H+-ATPase subunit C/Vma6|nr:V-type ATPase subunit [Treponema sp.]